MSEQPGALSTAFSAVPPQSIEAERSVLGALLQDGRAVSIAMEMLQEDDFYTPAHREIYSAIRALAQLRRTSRSRRRWRWRSRARRWIWSRWMRSCPAGAR